MALFVGSSLAKVGLLIRDDAESAFHPWWLTLQDYSLYSIILVGLFAIPTANNYLECSTLDPTATTPAHNSFVNGYCTRENLSLFISYLPYILILGPTVLMGLEMYFIKASSGGLKQAKFYALMVEDTVNFDELSSVLRESRRDVKEMRNEFKESRSFFVAFLIKTILETIVATAFGFWLIWMGYGNIYELDNAIKYVNYLGCTLKQVDFTCIMPHTVYYAYLVCITLCLGLIYWLASLYTLIWIIVKPMRSLSGYLRQYKSSIAKLKSNPSKGMTVKDGENNNEPQDVFGGLNSPDVEMLLDLLAETMGVPPALRILTLVDQEFLTAMRSQQLQQDNEILSYQARISFTGAPVGIHLPDVASKKILYVATITPCPAQAKYPEQIFFHKNDPLQRHTYLIFWEGLTPGAHYKVVVTTMFDGKAVAENYFEFTTRPLPPTTISVKWGFTVRSGGDIDYEATLTWTDLMKSESETRTYIVETQEDGSSLRSEVKENKYCHTTDGNSSSLRVKVWSVSAGNLWSENYLEQTLPPVPTLMKDYIRRLLRVLPQDAIRSKYLVQVELMKQLARELRDLYADMQKASAVSKTDQDFDDSIDVSDVFMGRSSRDSRDLPKVES